MLKVYHNPRCAKSRKGLEYLKTKTDDFTLINYIKDGLTPEEVKEILLKTNLEPSKLIRTQEDYFKKYLKGKKFSTEEWISIIVENPKLLKRPVIISKNKAVIADPPENTNLLFK